MITNDAKDFDPFEDHPGVLIVPQSGTSAGEVAAGVSQIERAVPDTSGLTLYVAAWT